MNKTLHAINEVRKEIGYIKREGKNQVQRYTYLGAEQLKAAIQKACSKHNLLWSTTIGYQHLHDVTTKSGNVMPCYGATVTLQFIHADEEGDPNHVGVLVEGIGAGADSGDKALMKAQTAAYREALKNAFCIPSGDQDPESDPTVDEEAGPKKTVTKRKTSEASSNLSDVLSSASLIKDKEQFRIFLSVKADLIRNFSAKDKGTFSETLKTKCKELGLNEKDAINIIKGKQA